MASGRPSKNERQRLDIPSDSNLRLTLSNLPPSHISHEVTTMETVSYTFVIDSPKKHSVKYLTVTLEGKQFAIYIPNGVLQEMGITPGQGTSITVALTPNP